MQTVTTLAVLLVASTATSCTRTLPTLPTVDTSLTDRDRQDTARVVTVSAVLDGDTLRVRSRTGADLGRVRLLGINAPELSHDGRPEQCYAVTATKLLARMTPPGTRIRLVRDHTQPSRDRYGRMLRYVQHASLDVEEQLLKAGAARPFTWHPPLERTKRYHRAADAAAAAHKGLWGRC